MRADDAKAYFLEGYNCAQSVLLAFADRTGMKKEDLAAIALPFGGGMGRLRETCGAVSGGALAIGLLCREKSKAEIYALVHAFGERFREENGSLNCGALLAGAGVHPAPAAVPEARTPTYYKKRPCPELVFSAAAILETLLGL